MGLFDIFKSKPSEKFDALLTDLVNEANQKKPDAYSDTPYHQLTIIKSIQELPPDELTSFMVFLMQSAKSDWLKQKSFSWSSPWYHAYKTVDQLLKHADLNTASLEKIAATFTEQRKLDPQPHHLPTLTLLTAMQRAIVKHGKTASTKDVLNAMLNDATKYMSNDLFKENDLILFLLQDDPSLQIAKHDKWGPVVIDYLRESTADTRDAWIALFLHSKTGTSKSTPTAKWMKEASVLVEKIGPEVFALQLINWLRHVQEMLQEVHKKKSNDFLREGNHEILKGLIWCVGIVNNASLNAALEDYAMWAYKKMPGIGSLSVRTGTAAMFAFSTLPVKEGVSRLSKFKTKIKNNSILKSIDKILRSLSEKSGLAMSDMEELAVPDFGISNGEIILTLENCIGRYSFDTGEITWLRGDKSQKSIPADIKEKFADEIKSFKNVIKEAEEMLPVIKNRLEQSYLQQREWDFESWYKLYVEHGLTSLTAKKLIWHFSKGGQKEQGIFIDNGFVTVKEQHISWLDASTKVQLWHPIGVSADKILEWRNFLRKHQIVQPFKQAYREVYIITDAELRTESYSNRYAAHILRQHQFAALLRQRGWHYTLQGNWDSHNTPYVKLAKWNLTAEYLVSADWTQNEANINNAGIFNYITTDQVRFISDQNTIALRDVPALVFSEIMRDVDLFVGVTSIGNDAAWQDGGDRLQNTYWHEYSFSDLTESAKIRNQVLESLIPSLKIAPVCSFDKKFLIVKGKLRTYKIHMGSGNILMEPDDRYLCIVPESKNIAKAGEKLFLPFEGDTILSIIISKAFLLADDDKIKDETITRQIRA